MLLDHQLTFEAVSIFKNLVALRSSILPTSLYLTSTAMGSHCNVTVLEVRTQDFTQRRRQMIRRTAPTLAISTEHRKSIFFVVASTPESVTS